MSELLPTVGRLTVGPSTLYYVEIETRRQSANWSGRVCRTGGVKWWGQERHDPMPGQPTVCPAAARPQLFGRVQPQPSSALCIRSSTSSLFISSIAPDFSDLEFAQTTVYEKTFKNSHSTDSTMAQQSVLMLGAGFVTKPTLDVLTDAGIPVTVACRTLQTAKDLAGDNKLATAISLDVNNDEALDAEVAKHDLVISLIPYIFHATVIKSAIRKKKNVVTTSYVSPAMMELDQQCKDAGITVMNEIGLDPGIDHLYAVKTIDEVHAAGGQITSFLSYCGGLAAPECSDNPLGYKFSWSSRGVLLALRNPAKIIQDGKMFEIASKDLMGTAKPYFIMPGYAFIAYPNRDSSVYAERYHIPEAKTIIRGTLRYQGFAAFIKCLVQMGFLEDTPIDALKSPIPWNEATQAILGAPSSDPKELEAFITSKVEWESAEDRARILSGLRWIGILSDEKITPRGNPLDTLCAVLEQKMQFEEGERDMVMLQHKFEITHKDGSTETRTSTLVEYGNEKYSAMAKLVGVTGAVAAKQILDGTLSEKGVLAPMTAKINNPIMKELKEKYGIEMKEKTVL
ncbi:Saccharopine dehydrogenase [NADP(+), L-glutamate-forming] [Claviceps purpurea]|nr:Saccharopine dehydrogenase [NADP(+), L-glutamate-forming] [Claviceps purpurea]